MGLEQNIFGEQEGVSLMSFNHLGASAVRVTVVIGGAAVFFK